MRTKVNIILLIVGHILTELAEVLQRLRPSLADVYIKPFINYTWPHDARCINLLWWVKYCTDDMLWIIYAFVLARVAALVSFRLFMVCSLWFIYHLFDVFMLWYDYRTSHWIYWVELGVIIGCIISMVLPEKDRARIVSLK